MKIALKKNLRKELRKNRNRARTFATPERLRLTVFRSNRYTHAQLIDDKGKVLAAMSTKVLLKKAKTKTEQAVLLGEALAEKVKKIDIKNVVFDRGLYKYHGRVKALAESFLKHAKKL